MFSDTSMPSVKTIVTTAASVAASVMVVRSIARELVPYELQHYLISKIRGFFKGFSSELTLIVEEREGMVANQIYKAIEIYLGTKASIATRIFKVSMPEKETKMSTSMAKNEVIADVFDNVIKLKWRQVTVEVEPNPVHVMYGGGRTSSPSESVFRHYELRFNNKYKDTVLDSYLPFIIKEATRLKREMRTLKIHTLATDQLRYTGYSSWKSVNLDHPSTFQTLAMDDEIKKTVMEDLERFVQRKDLYKRAGKAWKRGYLLYGPPGTGKSSLIAAMANYLKFDIYDLELSNVQSNSMLRSLLVGTANKSILVVEDIDCSLDIEDRAGDERMLRMLQTNQVRQAQTINIVQKDKQNQVTLSGLLNFIDGLWSSCGDERIIVFTTNHKDKLDPALLRPGRMDVHIHMSYCTPCGFKTLASNYLRVNEHYLFPDIEHLLKTTMVTPAEVGEQLLRNESSEGALQGLVEFLLEKKRDTEKMETRNLTNEEEEENKTQNAEEDTGIE